eukprot:m.167968 g.167968  ORF g.167968 m.167968 type:complete len:129 (-) comp12903_c0_seq1:994-1380(-)
MLRPKPLTDVLRQAATGGVKRVTLLKTDGSLLAYAGDGNSDADMHAALTSNIWRLYHPGSDAPDVLGDLNFVLLQTEQGKVVIGKVSSVLVALMSDESVGFGMLKAKAEALAAYLDEPLSQVDMMNDM